MLLVLSCINLLWGAVLPALLPPKPDPNRPGAFWAFVGLIVFNLACGIFGLITFFSQQ